jgi:hypothetical protein
MTHDIIFERDGSNVNVKIPTDLPYDEDVCCNKLFTHHCSSPSQAELLCRYLEDRHVKAIAQIREAEFRSGYKYGRSKKCGFYKFASFFTSMEQRASY